MLSDGYEVICSWVGNLTSIFGLSSAEEDDVKQFCDHQLSDGELRVNSRTVGQAAEHGGKQG
jgi:hypothetical protein